MRRIVRYVKPTRQWSLGDFSHFISATNRDERLVLMRGLDLLKPDASIRALGIKRDDTRRIEEQFCTRAKKELHLELPVRDGYHAVLRMAAHKNELPSADGDNISSFCLERRLFAAFFIKTWDALTQDQRRAALQKLSREHVVPNSVALPAESGSVALESLSVAVTFSGFAFYTGMSSFLCTAAGYFGVTLPFAAYPSASSTVALITGPVGLTCLAALAGAAGFSFIFRREALLLPAIIQIHLMKTSALHDAGLPIPV